MSRPYHPDWDGHCPVSDTDAHLLAIIDETNDDINLSPCQKASLLARELYSRFSGPEGSIIAELTEKGLYYLRSSQQ